MDYHITINPIKKKLRKAENGCSIYVTYILHLNTNNNVQYTLKIILECVGNVLTVN